MALNVFRSLGAFTVSMVDLGNNGTITPPTMPDGSNDTGRILITIPDKTDQTGYLIVGVSKLASVDDYVNVRRGRQLSNVGV